MLVVSTLILPLVRTCRSSGCRFGTTCAAPWPSPPAVGPSLWPWVCWFASASARPMEHFSICFRTVAWQTALFGLLTYTLGLRSFERRQLWDQGEARGRKRCFLVRAFMSWEATSREDTPFLAHLLDWRQHPPCDREVRSLFLAAHHTSSAHTAALGSTEACCWAGLWRFL